MKYVMNVCVVWDATAVQDHSAVGDMKDESLVITGVNTTAASMMRCYWGYYIGIVMVVLCGTASGIIVRR